MKLTEIKPLMEHTGYFVGYNELDPGELKKPLRPPYIFYLLPNSSNFFADGAVYMQITALRVELYTSKKDTAAELKLETVLNEAGISWDKSEIYIVSERLYVIVYESEVIISG